MAPTDARSRGGGAERALRLWPLALLFVAALALRLAYRIDHDEDVDALRFRLGVERFDPAELRPHAPFYPVFVAAAKLGVLLGASPRGALGGVSAIAGAAVVVLTALLAFEVLGRRAAWIAGALALASPFLWLGSEKLLSDMAGAAWVTATLWLLARARREGERARALRTAALVIAGIGLGIRLSYFPFAIAAVIEAARAEGGWRAYLGRARDLGAGIALWLPALVIAAGPRALVGAAMAQGMGHFTRWGGTAITVSSPTVRLGGVAWGLWANVLAGAFPDAPWGRWIGAPVLAILLAASGSTIFERKDARVARVARTSEEQTLATLATLAPLRSLAAGASSRARWLLGPAAAYLVWAVLGQNVAYKPRHLLPLAPLFVIALAAGTDAIARRIRGGIALVAILAAQWLVDGAALVAEHVQPSPAAALVAFAAADAQDPRPVLTRELGRMLAEGAPGRRIVRVDDDGALAAALDALGPEGALVTSDALSAAATRAVADRGLTLAPVFARPRSRYVDALWSELGLFAISRPPAHP